MMENNNILIVIVLAIVNLTAHIQVFVHWLVAGYGNFIYLNGKKRRKFFHGKCKSPADAIACKWKDLHLKPGNEISYTASLCQGM